MKLKTKQKTRQNSVWQREREKKTQKLQNTI